MSGVDFEDRRVRKGAADSVRRWVEDQGGGSPSGSDDAVDSISAQGGTPLVVAEAGVKDALLEGSHSGPAWRDLPEGHREARHRRPVRRPAKDGDPHRMITGDDPRTAAVIAQEAGVDDFLAEATPEDKMNLIKAEQRGGRLVTMTGDGTNARQLSRRPTSASR